jgi:peptide/nickel transport system substrate-binding protein
MNRVPLRHWALPICLLLVALMLASCGPAATVPSAGGETAAPAVTQAPEATTAPQETQAPALGRDPKTLVIAVYSNMSDFDPASNNEQLGNLILTATTEGLIRAKASNIAEFEPQLAESWEHNADYTVWTFHLRQNAKFHDGTPVNAEAVKFSFARLINSGLGMSFILSQFGIDPETQIIAKDEYTVEFQFDSPTPLLAQALSSGYGSYVESPTTLQANDQNGDLGHQWLQSHEAGSGPYMLTELSPNQQAVLTRNESWWGWDDGFHFDKIVLKVVPEQASRRSLIEKGDVDIAQQFTPEDYDALKQNPDIDVRLSEGLALQYIILGDYGPLQDPRVRQAISYAFDYDGYVNGIWKGYAERAVGPFPKKLLCHDPNVFQYQTDLEKAKQLLDEAGIQSGLELRYMTEEGSPSTIGPILQAQLAQLGINLTIEQRDTSSYIGMFYGDQQWPERPEIMSFTWWPDYNDPTDWAWVLFHTDAAGSSGANAGFYSNARADEIMDSAFSLTDQTGLCNLYKEFQDIVIQQDPAWIPLIEPPDEAVLRKDIGGYEANPLYRGTFDFSKMYRIGY